MGQFATPNAWTTCLFLTVGQQHLLSTVGTINSTVEMLCRCFSLFEKAWSPPLSKKTASNVLVGEIKPDNEEIAPVSCAELRFYCSRHSATFPFGCTSHSFAIYFRSQVSCTDMSTKYFCCCFGLPRAHHCCCRRISRWNCSFWETSSKIGENY